MLNLLGDIATTITRQKSNDALGVNGIVVVPRQDPDLDAFNRNPADGSLPPIASRPRIGTKCPNLRALPYLAGLLSPLYR